MLKDETIVEFNVRLLHIANESFSLGVKISKDKLVRKVFRFLPKRFDMKLTSILKARDVSVMKVDKLFGSLLMFEMTLKIKPDKKIIIKKKTLLYLPL